MFESEIPQDQRINYYSKGCNLLLLSLRGCNLLLLSQSSVSVSQRVQSASEALQCAASEAVQSSSVSVSQRVQAVQESSVSVSQRVQFSSSSSEGAGSAGVISLRGSAVCFFSVLLLLLLAVQCAS